MTIEVSILEVYDDRGVYDERGEYTRGVSR